MKLPSFVSRSTAATAAALCLSSAASLLAAPGDPDLTFGTNGVVNGSFTSIGLQSDGKIIALSGQTVRRFLPDGSPDNTFANGTGAATVPFPAATHERALAVLTDNKIVVAGALTGDFALLRLQSGGTPDAGFGTSGVATVNLGTYTIFPSGPPFTPITTPSDDSAKGILPLPAGGFVVAGDSLARTSTGQPESRLSVCSFNASGQVTGTGSQTYTNSPNVTFSALALLSSGKVFLAASIGTIAYSLYSPDTGSMDAIGITWDIHTPHEFDDRAYGAVARPDGAVLLCGDGGVSGAFLAALNSASGWQFGPSPLVFGQVPLGNSLALQPDGRIVLAGSALVRCMPDGNLDPSFRTLNVLSNLGTVALQSDGKILTAGHGSALRRFEGASTSATMAVELPAGTPFPGGGASPVDFGSVNTGATAAKTFTIRNTSATLPLQLWKTEIAGSSAAELTTDKTFPLTIAPGGSTTLTVEWKPLVHGPLSATFRLLNSDSARRALDFTLTGYALTAPPEVEVRADGTTPLVSGQPSILRLSHFRPRATLVFTNAGQQALTFTSAQIDGAAASFAYTSPVPATLAPAASHTASLQYLPGDNYVSALLHFGNNDANENPFDIYINGDPSTSSATWRNSWFTGFPAGALTADTDDYDRDGLTNLMEYATFNNPLVSGPSGITLTKTGNVLALTFTRPYEAITELSYELEWSDTLAAGSWKTLGTSSTVISDDSVRQQVKFTVPAGTGHRYVRLKVTRVVVAG